MISCMFEAGHNPFRDESNHNEIGKREF
jgi:hypothetical protein